MIFLLVYVVGVIITWIVAYVDSVRNGIQSKHVGNRRIAMLWGLALAVCWPLLVYFFVFIAVVTVIADWATAGDPR